MIYSEYLEETLAENFWEQPWAYNYHPTLSNRKDYYVAVPERSKHWIDTEILQYDDYKDVVREYGVDPYVPSEKGVYLKDAQFVPSQAEYDIGFLENELKIAGLDSINYYYVHPDGFTTADIVQSWYYETNGIALSAEQTIQHKIQEKYNDKH